MSNGFEDILSQADPGARELAIRAKALIQEVMPAVVEYVRHRREARRAVSA
jgi:hypothetical protein